VRSLSSGKGLKVHITSLCLVVAKLPQRSFSFNVQVGVAEIPLTNEGFVLFISVCGNSPGQENPVPFSHKHATGYKRTLAIHFCLIFAQYAAKCFPMSKISS